MSSLVFVVIAQDKESELFPIFQLRYGGKYNVPFISTFNLFLVKKEMFRCNMNSFVVIKDLPAS